jgi:hypothetical protein
MKTFLRILATLFTFVAVYYFTFWIPFAFVPISIHTTLIPSVVSLLAAVAISYFVWKKMASSSDGFVSHTIKSGLIVGAVGFILGFFGPLVLAPGANQGPLLGLFITGPLGLLIGLIAGAIHWKLKKSSATL